MAEVMKACWGGRSGCAEMFCWKNHASAKLQECENRSGEDRGLRFDPDHPVGKHKARIFKSVLGIGPDDFNILSEAIMYAVGHHHFTEGDGDALGQRYTDEL